MHQIATVADLLAATGQHPLLKWEVQIQILLPGTVRGGVADDPEVYVTPAGDLLAVPSLETLDLFCPAGPSDDLSWQESLHRTPPKGSVVYNFDDWERLHTALTAAQIMGLPGTIQMLDVATGWPHAVTADVEFGYIHITMPDQLLRAIFRKFGRGE